MNLIPSVVFFFGAIGAGALLGWDTYQNRKQITKAEMQQTIWSITFKPQLKSRRLFNRG